MFWGKVLQIFESFDVAVFFLNVNTHTHFKALPFSTIRLPPPGSPQESPDAQDTR